MPRIKTKIDPASDAYATNFAVNSALAEELRAVRERIELGGSERARDKHLARGKLLPRDRVRGLLDEGSDFLEIGTFAAHAVYEDDVPAAGVIAGIGTVSGVRCMIVANDATVKGGTY